MNQIRKLAVVIVAIIAVCDSRNVQADPILDQQNVPTNAQFNHGLFWQQEIIVGVDGILTGLEVLFVAGVPRAGTFYIWLGSPWQADAPIVTIGYDDIGGTTFFEEPVWSPS